MKKYSISFWDDCGKLIYKSFARKIDITDLQTIVYLYCEPEVENSEKYTSRLIMTLKSMIIVDGVITVYYVNNSYCEITRLQRKNW
jgi:hypothetical protein